MSGAPRFGPLSYEEQSRLAVARHRLLQIPAQGSPEAVFEVLADCAPIVGGLVGTFCAGQPGSTVSHVVGLPQVVFTAWVGAPTEDLRRMLGPLVVAAPGELISDGTAIVGPDRQKLGLLELLRDEGLGEAAGYKIASEARTDDGSPHLFMTLALDRGRTFTPEHRKIFANLHTDIQEAFDRIRIPLMASQSILMQIIEEDEIGFICWSPSGRIVEMNHRAYALVDRYLGSAGIMRGRGALDHFVERMLKETAGRRTWHLVHEDSGSAVDVSMYRLTRQSHAILQDVVLIQMHEAPVPDTRIRLESIGEHGTGRRLTPMQLRVARLVCEGRSAKEIAQILKISPLTAYKHLENVRAKLQVNSKELQARFR